MKFKTFCIEKVGQQTQPQMLLLTKSETVHQIAVEKMCSSWNALATTIVIYLVIRILNIILVFKLSMDKKKNNGKLLAKLKVKDSNVYMIVQVDTGAEVNVLPVRCFKQIYPQYEDLSKCSLLTPKPFTKLTAYNGEQLYHHGTLKLKCFVGNAHDNCPEVEFYVCETEGPIILGLHDSCKFKLVSVSSHVKHVTVSAVHNEGAGQQVQYPVVNANATIQDSKSLISMYPDRFSGQG